MSPAPTAAHPGTSNPRTSNPRTSRGRRTPRPSGDDRQLAILATAERLLEDRPLSEISINDLARGAGISRPTFYFYFASKDAVLLALLDSVVEQAQTAAADVLDHLAEDPPARWREAISAFYEAFRSHRAVTLACAQVRRTNAEVRQLWATVMEGWVHCTAVAIEAERKRGAAPAGLPARDLAVALNSMNERVLYATFSDDGPAVVESSAVDVLLNVWLNSIYQTTTPQPTALSRKKFR
ncbi:MAG: TetR/AcrR family transcriptional regulator [Pseudonocardiales bacterium]|nr:TetR/AcrR family transcriptional regulator [Pseudonocardiales bacterium]MBV9730353.1 TetR/AcrR family transcriptional regulator [Pseudonocardiales bacterium]